MACNLGLHALCILMELTCFMAEWLKVNSPNRWDSLKTNLNFKHSFFSHCKAKAHNNRKVVFYHRLLWLIERKKRFITSHPLLILM